jgi:hypothetical protein
VVGGWQSRSKHKKHNSAVSEIETNNKHQAEIEFLHMPKYSNTMALNTSNSTDVDASALFVAANVKGKEEDVLQESMRMIGSNISCDTNANYNNTSDEIKSTNDSRSCRENIHDLLLTSLTSPRNEDCIVLKAKETIATHPSETTETKISSSTSMSNHTCLTLGTTQSSRSGDSGEKDHSPTIPPVATSASSSEILKRDRSSPVSCTESVAEELVESQSSASQASVISNWANKYDTEDKDNYDSDSDYDEKEARQDSREAETRESVEEARGEDEDIRDSEPVKILAAIMSDDAETEMWNCGVSEFIAETSQTSNGHQAMISKKEDEQKDGIIIAAAAAAKDDLVSTKSQEETDGSNNDSVIEQNDCEHYYDTIDECDDESAAEWFVNIFHKSDVTGFNKSSRSMRMVGSIPLSSASHHEDDIPECKNDVIEATDKDAMEGADKDAMDAELGPFVFELDKLDTILFREREEEEVVFHEASYDEEGVFHEASYDEEEEVVFYEASSGEEDDSFHEAYSEEDDWLQNEADDDAETEEISSHSSRITDEALAPVTEVNGYINEGGDFFLKITDAIDTLCLSPQAQELFPGQNCIFHGVDVMERDDRTINTSASSSSSCTETPNIELELHSTSDSEEIDKIIVVDAVARALRRSKKRSKYKTEPKRENIDNNSPSQVSSDAMDVLMSLKLMEFCIPNDLSIAWSESTASNNKHREKVSKTKWLYPCDQIQNSEEEIAITSVIKDNAMVESMKENEVSKPLLDKRATDSRTIENISSVIEAETKNDWISGLEIQLNNSIIPDVAVESPEFQLDTVVIKELGLMVDSDSFSIDELCDKSLSDNDPIRAKPNAMIESTTPKPSNRKFTTVPLRGDGNNNIPFHRLSTTMSSSFELVNSLSSSDDCHIPSPPRRTKNVVSRYQDQKHETLPFEASSKSVPLPMMDSISLQSATLPPICVLPSTRPLKSSISPALPPLPISKKKKKKAITAFHKQLSTSLSGDECPIQSPSRTEEALKDPLFDSTTREDGRQRKIMPHLAINRMIRNAKKKSSSRKNTLAINQKTALGSFNEKCRTEDSLRLRQKLFPLPSPSSFSRKFCSSKIVEEEEKDQENCSPIPCQEPRHVSVGHALPKGIIRAPTTPSNLNRSVHWDEEQLANKVDKGIMIVSSRKRRPIRKLEQLMLQITAVQNDYDSELNQLIGLKSTAQGYIC